MIGYYFKLATKTLRKYQFHSAVSLISLATGFLCFIAANVVAAYLTSWDRHFPESERIFTVNSSHPNPRPDGLPFVPRHLASYLENELAEIELTATERPGREYDVSIDGASERMRVTFVEGDYLRIFPLPLVSSDRPLAELSPGSALIMERAALARFGTTDVVGRQIVIAQRHELSIVGVVSTMDRPSHLQSNMPGADDADLVAPMRVSDALSGVDASPGENWHDTSHRTYVKLAAGVSLDPRDYAQRLAELSERHVPIKYYTTGPHRTVFSLHPLTETGTSYLRFVFADIGVTALLTFAGFLVLLVACLNYSNLVIAQLTDRGHEITVQKVVGATRRHLVAQYSFESFAVAGLAFLIALAVCAAILIGVDALRAMGFHAGLLLTPRAWIAASAALAAIAVVAGAYPALRVTRDSLPSMLRPVGSTGYSHRLRSLMVGVQFAFSSVLVIFAIFVVQQNRTMLAQATGDDLDPVLVVRNLAPESADELDRLEAGLRRDGSVAATSRSKLFPWELATDAIPLFRSPDLSTPFIALNRIAVGHDYFDTMQMPLVAGRTFSRDRAADLYPAPAELRAAAGPYSVVIDEATAARLRFDSAADAVGEEIYTSYVPPVVDTPRFVPLTIVGVVANRALEIASIGYAPTHVFTLSPSEARNVLVRPAAGRVAGAHAQIERVWRDLYPASTARPEALDELFARSYSVVERFGNVFVWLALLAFGVASIGLISMVTFVVSLRQREVGIRKILGASKRRVARMLLLDFVKPVLVANLVAWPVGFALASAYLSIFYVRAPVTITPFLLCLALTLGVAVLVVTYQARGSSRLRPAAVLKYE